MFKDSLRAVLSLTIEGTTFSVPAGDIGFLELTLEPWGFTGRASWWAVAQAAGEDPLFASFLSRPPIELSLSVARALDDPAAAAEPIVVKALVTARDVVERVVASVAGAPVLQRRYSVEFADRARALWSQHLPTSLHVYGTLKDLIDGHVPAGMTLTHSWTAEDIFPVLSVGLGSAPDGASFYDFVGWLLDARGAALSYDRASDAYTIVDAKPAFDGEPKLVEREKVAVLDVDLPATLRAVPRVLNAYTGAATQRKELANDQAVLGVVSDFLLRTSVEGDVTARAALETIRARPAGAEVRATFRRFPAVPLAPGDPAKLDQAFGPSLFASGKTLRVVRARVVARAESDAAGDDLGAPTKRYDMDYEVLLEDEAELVFRRAPFRAPVWPFHVEGQIVSEVGAPAEDTYQPYTDSETSIDQYKIKIPLWGKTVVASFEPNLMPGHFYFPAYKEERVKVALYFDRASIRCYLDWRAGARLPLEAQGDELLMGKTMANGTSITHAYEGGKPNFVILRTSAADVQTIEVREGKIWMEAREEET